MLRHKLLSMALASTVALGGITAAGAAFASTASHHSIGEKLVLEAKTSPTDAIGAAEKSTNGKALMLQGEWENKTPVYDIRTAAGDKLFLVYVDMNDGKVVKTEEIGEIGRLHDSAEKLEAAAIEKATTSLSTAVETAEKQVGGRAVEAALEKQGGKTDYHVDVSKDKTIHHVVVDPSNGQVLSAQHAEATATKHMTATPKATSTAPAAPSEPAQPSK